MFAVRPLLRRKTTAIHSVSRYVASRSRTATCKSRACRRVVIPNFHEDETDATVDQQILERLPKEPFILFVGAFRQLKGIDELIEAYQSSRSAAPGDGRNQAPDTPESFPAGVTCSTAVPHATVMAMWDRALFGVFPSKWPEPLGDVVHEAMSSGRAVIGTTPGGHEDMIDDGETGFLVPGGDAEAWRARWPA